MQSLDENAKLNSLTKKKNSSTGVQIKADYILEKNVAFPKKVESKNFFETVKDFLKNKLKAKESWT